MNIIVGIHVDTADSRKLETYIHEQLKKDPKTVFIFLSVNHSDPKHPSSVTGDSFVQYLEKKSKLGLTIGKNLFNAKFNVTNHINIKDFNLYKKSFRKISLGLKKQLKPREKANIITFGGAANDCYYSLNPDVHEEAAMIMGREHKGNHYSESRMVYGRTKIQHLGKTARGSIDIEKSRRKPRLPR